MQLLTAFVDGELSQRQRKAAMHLLEKSSEARALLKELQENVHKLKKLSFHKIEPSLVDDVLQAIAGQQASPKPIVPGRRPWLPYLAASMAVSLLIVTVGLIYWKTVIQTPVGPRDNYLDIVKNDKDLKIPNPVPPRKIDHRLLAKANAITQGTFRGFSTYLPPPKPYEFSFGDLVRVESKESSELAHRLNLENSVHLEITVSNNDAALARLRSALLDRKIKLIADPDVNKILKNKTSDKTEFLVYAENLSTDDVTKLMRELSNQYIVGQGMNQKMVPSPYQKLALAPNKNDDLRAVAKVFGVDVDAIDLQKRKNGNVEPARERKAVLVPLAGMAAPSSEVRQFVNQRSAPQPGKLQVIITIRQK